jgi:hypothetical protein
MIRDLRKNGSPVKFASTHGNSDDEGNTIERMSKFDLGREALRDALLECNAHLIFFLAHLVDDGNVVPFNVKKPVDMLMSPTNFTQEHVEKVMMYYLTRSDSEYAKKASDDYYAALWSTMTDPSSS